MQRVFISFDFDHDEDLKNALVGQAKYPNSPFEIADWSVKEPFTGNWKAKVQDRIKTDQCNGRYLRPSYRHRQRRGCGNSDQPLTRQAILPAQRQEGQQ